ncbi:hypothetical protein NVP2275O_403 [Vibrio phage 2.275.O._10N.286.54.E11]|nr:hypothetical protein NVP2275O_403 [Vibrio phage 2.275.O._10N.286.54.E11]
MWDKDAQETRAAIAAGERASRKNSLIGTFAREMMPYLKEQYPEVYADLILQFNDKHNDAITECHRFDFLRKS